MFYLVFNSIVRRSALIQRLKENDIQAVFHYLSLHSSPFYQGYHGGRKLPLSDYYSECLVRLPLYFDLDFETIDVVCRFIGEIES